MRQDTRDRTLPLSVAFALAVAAHGGVFAVLAHARSEGGRLPVIRGEIAPEDVDAPRDDSPDEVALGIDANTPSSMTWIGFEQYEEHIARLSEVEQPALDENPSGGGGGTTPTALITPEPTPGAAEASAEMAAAQPPSTPTTADPAAAAEAASETAAAASAGTVSDPTPPTAATAADAAIGAEAALPSIAPPATPPTDVASSATPPTTTPDGTLPLVASVVIPPVGAWAFGRSTPDDAPPIADGILAAQPEADGATGIARTDGDGEAERDVTAEVPNPAASLEGTTTAAAPAGTPTEGAAAAPPLAPPTPATAASASGSPSAPGPVGSNPNTNGNQSDRESDPTSLVDVPPDQWKRGKPLAARGIEIKTRRPVFPELTRLTSAPANPIVEILFDRTGVPRKARVLKSSGDPRIDGPVIDSLYRWRASGESLTRLRDGETLRIEMRLLLGG